MLFRLKWDACRGCSTPSLANTRSAVDSATAPGRIQHEDKFFWYCLCSFSLSNKHLHTHPSWLVCCRWFVGHLFDWQSGLCRQQDDRSSLRYDALLYKIQGQYLKITQQIGSRSDSTSKSAFRCRWFACCVMILYYTRSQANI